MFKDHGKMFSTEILGVMVLLLLLLVAVQIYACQADKVDLGAMKFNEDMGSRMTEYVIDPVKNTAQLRRVSVMCGTCIT